jgi:hypothetical protein
VSRWLVALVVVALLLAATRARADGGAPPPTRTEVGVFPGVNYNSDLGLGMGAVVGIARIAPDAEPYRWRMQALLYLSLKEAPEGGVEIVEHDDYLDFDRPGLAGGRLRLRGRLTFHRLGNTGWYGLGNDAGGVSGPPRANDYRKLQARADGYARVRAARSLEVYGGLRLTGTSVAIYPDSALARDADRLVGVGAHGEVLTTAGVLWDVRDDEYVPTAGWLVEAALRGGGGLEERFGYAGATLSWRAFAGIAGERVVLAARLLGDLIVGDAPFYELARHGGIGNADATGGGTSIRGVPAQRYHGRGKLLGSGEVRFQILPFRLWRQRFRAGAAVFVDGGRVFHDPALDGGGLGLHLGIGGGLRIQWGETFIGRADWAGSPEGTSGLYLGVGHIF